jgi:hypothetical protein
MKLVYRTRVPSRLLEFRIMRERPMSDLEQDNSVRYWKTSGRNERAGKKLKRKSRRD